MISRVAENVYWMQRYVERAEGTARLLQTASSVLVDVPDVARWTPVLTVAGEQPRFIERFGEEAQEEGEVVMDFLTWDRDCPASILSSVAYARENARTVRDAISREVWEVVNGVHLWIESADARKLYEEDRLGFFGRLRSFGHEFTGAADGTMLRDEPLAFLHLGRALERADQTARALDVKHHMLGPTSPDTADTSADTVAWLATLLSCSAYEAYFKRNRGSVRGRRVARLLVLDAGFPRSVRAAVGDAIASLVELADPERDLASYACVMKLSHMMERLETMDVDALLQLGIHEELTRVVEGLGEASGLLYGDFFDPAIRSPAPIAAPEVEG